MQAPILIDDGTMDTVYLCPYCGQTESYSAPEPDPDDFGCDEESDEWFYEWRDDIVTNFYEEHECPESFDDYMKEHTIR